MNGKKTRLFVDMDGTLAEWQEGTPLEEVCAPGYFAQLPPNENMAKAMIRFWEYSRKNNIEVFILSAVFDDGHSIRDKNAWLDQYIPFIDAEHRIFVSCEEPKTAYINKHLGGMSESDMFIVKGFIPDGIDNIAYELTGCWSIDKNRNQPYLDVQKANISIPTRKKSVIAFLRSNCKGIGNVKATAIANAFGENTLSVCANEPEKLKKKVPSLTDKDIKALKHGCQALTYKYDIRCFLDDKNIVLPDYQIDAIADEYGAEALNVIKEKPYKLITLLPFQTCDKIGLAMGVSPNARRRYVAALVEAQKQLCRQNNTVCVREDLLVAEAYKLLNHHNDELMKMSVKLLVDNYRFIRFGSSKSGNWIYSKDDYTVERNLARKLAAFIKRGPSKQKEIDAALAKWKKNSPIQLSEKQEEAVRNLAYPISIVTGGPGTGKSTTLRACLEVYKEAFKKNATILCMAPTGRASKRMAECTGLPAQTIHSACALVPSKAAGGFTAQDDCKISENLIAIDEMSMVGIHLFDFVMNAIENEPNKKIILLGDVDQLPSVTPGNVLFDLIKCNQIKYTVLDRNYRQGSNSTIADAAYAINNGMSNLPTDETFQFIDCHNPDSEKETEDISNIIIQKYQEGVKKYGRDGCIVLSPTHYYKSSNSSPLCTDIMNKKIQDIVNEAEKGKPEWRAKSTKSKNGVDVSRVFRKGDRVVQIKNTPEIMNGDLGTIDEIIDDDGVYTFKITFDDKQVEYDVKDMQNVELGYCITVHKTQGSEFPCCIMPASMTQKAMLQRQLFYTGVTRAKKEFIFVGDKKALDLAVRTKTEERRSMLPARICKECV